MLGMTPSPWLYDFLKSFEQFRPTAYKPTKGDKWTIGYGHTKGVKPGDTCTLAEAEAFLIADVAWAAAAVNRCVTVPLNQRQFDALVSFTFNCGAEALFGSTLLHKLDAGDYAGAAAQFPKWDHQHGVELAGLERRREAEELHFLSAA